MPTPTNLERASLSLASILASRPAALGLIRCVLKNFSLVVAEIY